MPVLRWGDSKKACGLLFPKLCSGDEGKDEVNPLLLFMEPPDSTPMVKRVTGA